MSSSGIAGSYGSFMPRFLRNLHAVLIVAISIHTHTMKYYSALKRNKFESVGLRWINLEPVIQGEARQKVKHNYILTIHIWNLEKWY